jgi:DNA-directed RNA polymerase beta' subunit
MALDDLLSPFNVAEHRVNACKYKSQTKNLDAKVAQIKEVKFSLLSPDQIITRSSACITKATLYSKAKPTTEGLLDLRMGTTSSKFKCMTCDRNASSCLGHPGHHVLPVSVLSPTLLPHLVKILRCFCFNCSSLLVHLDDMTLNKTLEEAGAATSFTRLTKVTKMLNTKRKCQCCLHPTPDLKAFGFDIGLTWNESALKSLRNYYVKEGFENKKLPMSDIVVQDDTRTARYKLAPNDLKSFLEKLPNAHLEKIGINTQICHPKNAILSVLPVCPPIARPPSLYVSGKIQEHDLTQRLQEVLRASNRLKKLLTAKNKPDHTTKQKQGMREIQRRARNLRDNLTQEQEEENVYEELCASIAVLFNSDSLPRLTTQVCEMVVSNQDHAQAKKLRNVSSRARRILSNTSQRSLLSQLTGKFGICRNLLMGKRVDKTARSVASMSHLSPSSDVILPQYIANKLTLPTRVQSYNIAKIRILVRDSSTIRCLYTKEMTFDLSNLSKEKRQILSEAVE